MRIKNLTGLKGKRLKIGDPGSGTTRMAFVELERHSNGDRVVVRGVNERLEATAAAIERASTAERVGSCVP